jgi:hypothetical protein
MSEREEACIAFAKELAEGKIRGMFHVSIEKLQRDWRFRKVNNSDFENTHTFNDFCNTHISWATWDAFWYEQEKKNPLLVIMRNAPSNIFYGVHHVPGQKRTLFKVLDILLGFPKSTKTFEDFL